MGECVGVGVSVCVCNHMYVYIYIYTNIYTWRTEESRLAKATAKAAMRSIYEKNKRCGNKKPFVFVVVFFLLL